LKIENRGSNIVMQENNHKFSLRLGDKDLQVEINELAEQANGSALVRYGDTVVLATAVMAKKKNRIKVFPFNGRL